MPITFLTAAGKREQMFPNRSGTNTQTIVQWHGNSLRFVVVELQSLLYGLDIRRYTQPIVLQLQNTIPSYEQLFAWVNRIDSRAVKARVLVGQLFEEKDRYALRLQASDEQTVWLYRDSRLYRLSVDQKGMEGTLVSKDELLLGSQNLMTSFENVPLSGGGGIEQKLDYILMQYTSDVQTLMVRHQGSSQRDVRGVLAGFKKVTEGLYRKPQKPKVDAPPIVNKPFRAAVSKRRFALSLALMFLLLLSVSVGLGVRKRQQFARAQQEKQLIEDVSYRLEQAKSLQELNPTRAKTLLSDAKQVLSEHTSENRLTSEAVKRLETEVALAYEQVSGLILVQQAPLFYDPLLLGDGFVPKQLAVSDNEAVLLDQARQVLAAVSLESKAAKILAGTSQVPAGAKVASTPDWAFLYADSKLTIIDKQTQKTLKSFTLSSTMVSDMAGYGSNLYILDKPAGQVVRLRGTKDSLSRAEDYFDEKQDLDGAVSLAVDGSAWILYSNGAVEKYTSGLRDALFPDFGLDKPLQQPSALFTDENQKNLYILDKSQARIVAISKQGEFKAEYTWEGLGSCDDLIVSEKIDKILVLRDGKIWGIGLK